MANEPRLDEERISLARDLLREAVFQSRAKQAAGTSLARSDPNSKAGNCGLGAHAAIESRLSDKGRELAANLWPAELAPESAARVETLISAWVERQDALDRKRNHFLRDFRTANGFDRAKYTAEQLAAFESGLERVNAEEDRLRSSAAEELAKNV
ncbi:MAG TPA: hypothetical protein VK843_15150 [Planctomycetota bacterium]|nr:hypothetical protein [Planctomycetota bacterium]